MAGRTVSLRVGGQTYRVVTSASEEELQRLAAVVDDKLSEVVPKGRPVPPQARPRAALSPAPARGGERARAQDLGARARGAFGKMLERVAAALAPPGDRASPSGGAASVPHPPGPVERAPATVPRTSS